MGSECLDEECSGRQCAVVSPSARGASMDPSAYLRTSEERRGPAVGLLVRTWLSMQARSWD